MSTNVEQIKERLSIVDVISGYIKVEKAGINFKAKCPFHNEKTPSFFISPTRQTFYCFGCQEKGDIFSFVEKFEGLDFKGALQTLADRAGIKLDKFKSEEVSGREKDEKDKLFEIMEEAAKFYEQELGGDKTSLEYLKKRGLLKDSISKWRLGFAKDGWRSLHDYLLQKGFSKKEMLLAGLIKKILNEDKYYDTFRNRIMFPICDAAGRVIAFSGRALREDEKTPKYLNSPETKLFYKSEVLYGFNIAKNYIRKMDYAVLVEGQMDLIMSHQANVLNTVASSGTALTELHLKKIQKLSNRVIIAYDSDIAGEKAAIRAAELALISGMEVKIATLPKGEDPASVAKEDPEKWKEALKNSAHILDFVLDKAVSGNSGRNLTKEVIKNVLPLTSLLKSEIEKSQFVKKIALKMKVAEEAVWDDLRKIERFEEGGKAPFQKYAKITDLKRMMAAIGFLEESTDKKSGQVREKWEEIVGEKEVAEILENFKEDKEALIFEAESYGGDSDLKDVSKDLLKRIELQNLKQKLQSAAAQLDEEELSKETENKTRLEFEKIQKRIKELNN
jgi:DNA primase